MMDELLTTSQLLDKLKHDETAKVMTDHTGMLNGEELTNFNDCFIWKKGGVPLYINDTTLRLKWRILPKPIKYVTFEEAMKALKNGKKIKVDNGIRVFDKNEDMEDSVGSYANWEDLLHSKWQIIE